MTSIWLNQILQGVLIGGLYALYAVGLSLSVGVMRFVNIAHGDLIVLACFAQWALVVGLGLDPLVAAPILIVVCAVCAWLLQRLLLERVLKGADAAGACDLRPVHLHPERIARRFRGG